MGSKPGGKRANWSNPAGWLFKDIIVDYYARGFRQEALAECFRRHVPREVYVPMIGGIDVNDNAIDQRGHKAYKYGPNAFEHADKHPMGIKMMPYAKQVIADKQKLTALDVEEIVRKALGSQDETINIDKVSVDEKGTIGLIYIASTGSDRSNFGMTTKEDAEQRIKGFEKGDIDLKMRVVHIMWLDDVRKIDTMLKRHFKDLHEGAERYHVPADTVWHYLKVFCDREQVAHFRVMENGRRLSKEAAE